jgi:GntR family transcriptional regulator
VAADPLYRQIAQDLKHKIDSGELEPGKQLPNEEELKAEYKASRNTVRDAIKWLAIRGLIVTRPGLGTFVVHRPEPFVTTLSEDRDPEAGMAGGEGVAAFAEIRERLRQKRERERRGSANPGRDGLGEDTPGPEGTQDGEPWASKPVVEVKEAPDWVAVRLRINADDEVVVRHQEFYIGSTPWSLQTTFYPMDLVGRGATALLRPQDITEGTIKYLRDKLGLVQCGSRLRILVRAPNEDEARFFGLPDDGRISVVSLIRTGYEDRADEGPYSFRVVFTILPADRNQFVVNRGKVPDELAAPALDQ